MSGQLSQQLMYDGSCLYDFTLLLLQIIEHAQAQ